MSTLSVIVITRNEEADIEACLQSVAGLANEIVLVDSGSTDATLKIAERFTKKIFHNDWPGYGPQKQFALNKASGPWVLNLDADERVTPELKKEIQALLLRDGDGKNGFDIPFHHYFLGQRLRFGGVQGETHLRLFRKNGSSYGESRIHEGISVLKPIGRCRNAIDHFSYRDLAEYEKKREEYTTLIAQQKFAQGARYRFWHAFRLPLEFFIRYILRLGFLDGAAGLTYARLSSVYVWMKFRKLRDLVSTKN